MPAARKNASCDASLMSHASARHSPPPIAGPLTAAMTGWCSPRSASTTSSRISIARSATVTCVSPSVCGIRPRSPLWSAPEQNPLPAPVSTTARTSLSFFSSPSRSRNGTIASNDIEFIRSG